MNTLNEKEKFGDLRVSKQVIGSNIDANKEFSFTIELSDSTINGVYGDMTFLNGIANISLKHNEAKSAKGLPVGISYKVSEVESYEYETSYKGNESMIEVDRIAICNVTNIYLPPEEPKPVKPPYIPPRTGIQKKKQ